MTLLTIRTSDGRVMEWGDLDASAYEGVEGYTILEDIPCPPDTLLADEHVWAYVNEEYVQIEDV